MTTVVDARGLSCPEPVIVARKAIDAGKFPIVILVDTPTARENVCRLARRLGCQVTEDVQGDEARLTVTR